MTSSRAGRVFTVFIAAAALAACATPPRSMGVPPPPAGMTRHASPLFKGAELYSWRDDGHWRFSLLVGTNRSKSIDEIRAPATTLAGMDELRANLARLAPGETVSWFGPQMPGELMEDEIRMFCRSLGLRLSTPRQLDPGG